VSLTELDVLVEKLDATKNGTLVYIQRSTVEGMVVETPSFTRFLYTPGGCLLGFLKHQNSEMFRGTTRISGFLVCQGHFLFGKWVFCVKHLKFFEKCVFCVQASWSWGPGLDNPKTHDVRYGVAWSAFVRVKRST